jgi:hypothetical protein
MEEHMRANPEDLVAKRARALQINYPKTIRRIGATPDSVRTKISTYRKAHFKFTGASVIAIRQMYEADPFLFS